MSTIGYQLTGILQIFYHSCPVLKSHLLVSLLKNIMQNLNPFRESIHLLPEMSLARVSIMFLMQNLNPFRNRIIHYQRCTTNQNSFHVHCVQCSAFVFLQCNNFNSIAAMTPFHGKNNRHSASSSEVKPLCIMMPTNKAVEKSQGIIRQKASGTRNVYGSFAKSHRTHPSEIHIIGGG